LAKDATGIALLPVSELHEEIEHGRLVQILPSWQGPKRDIFAVWPSGRLLSAKAKCFRDFMQSYISRQDILQGAC